MLAELRASIVGDSCTSRECAFHPHASSLLIACATDPFGLFVGWLRQTTDVTYDVVMHRLQPQFMPRFPVTLTTMA